MTPNVVVRNVLILLMLTNQRHPTNLIRSQCRPLRAVRVLTPLTNKVHLMSKAMSVFHLRSDMS